MKTTINRTESSELNNKNTLPQETGQKLSNQLSKIDNKVLKLVKETTIIGRRPAKIQFSNWKKKYYYNLKHLCL